MKNDSVMVAICCSAEEKEKAKKLAKSKGMTFSGWLGQLIKRELAVSKLQTPSSSITSGSPISEELATSFDSGGRK